MDVVVTGSNGQLGQEYVRILREYKANVIGIDITGQCDINLDITDQAAVSNFWKNIGPIDCLINNAGIGVFTDGLGRSKEDFMKVLEINLWGTYNMIMNYIKFSEYECKKRIINIASLYGHISSDYRIYGKSKRNNSEVYSASKAGVIGLTKYIAANYSQRSVICNSVSPGGVLREQTSDFVLNYSGKSPQARLADADEIGKVVKFLALDSPDHLNGEDIKVDGGFSIW